MNIGYPNENPNPFFVKQEDISNGIPKIKKHTMDEKYITQRERNRLAVRNCRKRKKQQAENLAEKIRILKQENETLRKKLKDGKGNWEKLEGTEETLSIDKVVSDLENSFKEGQRTGDKNNLQVDKVVQLFLEKFVDHGRDKQKTISFLGNNMKKLVAPVPLTTSYFALMTANTKDFKKNDKGLMKYLQLSDKQMELLGLRTVHAKRIMCEVIYTKRRTESMWQHLCSNKPSADSIYHLNSVLTAKQLAKFFIWVYTDPACKDILDNLWALMLKKFEPSIRKALISSTDFKSMKLAYQKSAARLCANVFHSSEGEKEKTLKKIMHKNVTLTDLNNGGEYKGIEGIIHYKEKVMKAFTKNTMRTSEVSLKVYEEENKITSFVEDAGFYVGMLNEGSEPIPVKFTVVLDMFFGDPDQPDKITEYLISWDAMSLLNQIRAYRKQKKLKELVHTSDPLL
eukprot:snap_masked-scaffold_32-processed-gene-3.17-mRNA-1 protein AED:1.00 eAED:1.00 QI:0/-1/0/0/-1/1/1/0/454